MGKDAKRSVSSWSRLSRMLDGDDREVQGRVPSLVGIGTRAIGIKSCKQQCLRFPRMVLTDVSPLDPSCIPPATGPLRCRWNSLRGLYRLCPLGSVNLHDLPAIVCQPATHRHLGRLARSLPRWGNFLVLSLVECRGTSDVSDRQSFVHLHLQHDYVGNHGRALGCRRALPGCIRNACQRHADNASRNLSRFNGTKRTCNTIGSSRSVHGLSFIYGRAWNVFVGRGATCDYGGIELACKEMNSHRC